MRPPELWSACFRVSLELGPCNGETDQAAGDCEVHEDNGCLKTLFGDHMRLDRQHNSI